MSNSTGTIKIFHNNEIRKLKEVNSFRSLAETITNKLGIELTHFEMTYYDEEGDIITISNQDDFDECMNVFHPKIPKIFLKPKNSEAEEEVKDPDAFPDIALTVSTCERPDQRSSLSSAPEEDPEEEQIPVLEKVEIEKPGVKDYQPQELLEEDKQSEASEAWIQTEEKIPESDEKWTSVEINDIPLNSSSIQTQSVENVETGTDADNLVEVADMNINTEMLDTVDRANQNEVNIAESGNDPMQIEVINQEINTNLLGEPESEEKSEEPKYSEEDFNNAISNAVKTQMSELTPILMEECKKYLLTQSQSVENNKIMSIGQIPANASCYSCEKKECVEVRYFCGDCTQECTKQKELESKIKESIHENFVSCVNKSINSETNSEKEFKSIKDAESENNSEKSAKSSLRSRSEEPKDTEEKKIGREESTVECPKPTEKIGETVDNFLDSSDSSEKENEEEKLKEEEGLNKLNEDPIVTEEVQVPVEEEQEYPEMVKRSVLMEYKPFSDDIIRNLQVRWTMPEDIIHIIDRETDSFNVELEAMNSDASGATRWPIYSTLVILNSNHHLLEKCTSTTKEIRSGVKAKFSAKVKTPKDKNFEVFQFQIIDEFGRKFGGPKQVRIKISDENIIDLREEVVEPVEPEKPLIEMKKHKAEELYPEELSTLLAMGYDVDEKVMDGILKAKGNIENFFENFQ